jgi:hypothetical protein
LIGNFAMDDFAIDSLAQDGRSTQGRGRSISHGYDAARRGGKMTI